MKDNGRLVDVAEFFNFVNIVEISVPFEKIANCVNFVNQAFHSTMPF